MNIVRRRRRSSQFAQFAQIQNPLRRFILRLLDSLDLLIYAFVGVGFLAMAILIAGFATITLIAQLSGHTSPLPTSFLYALLQFGGNLLLILIVMEVVGSVRSYLERGDSSVKPFLFVSIIVAVRGILLVSVQVSQAGNQAHLDTGFLAVQFGCYLLIIGVAAVTIRLLGVSSELPTEDANDLDDPDEDVLSPDPFTPPERQSS